MSVLKKSTLSNVKHCILIQYALIFKKKNFFLSEQGETKCGIHTSVNALYKVPLEGLALRQACCSYGKAFSCSYIFIFCLEVLENEHTWNWGQNRLGTRGVCLRHRYRLVRTGESGATLGSLFPPPQLTLARKTMTFSQGF